MMGKKQVLFSILYFVFYDFVKESYNGIIRQILKMLLNELKDLINVVLNVDASSDVGFLLAIFEKHMATKHISRDRFDLISLRDILISKEDIAAMNMTQPLEECNICELNRLTPIHMNEEEGAHQDKSNPTHKPADRGNKSKHVVICISGFLQQETDLQDFWRNMQGYYKHAEMFFVSWNACNMTNILNAGTYDLQKSNSGKEVKNHV